MDKLTPTEIANLVMEYIDNDPELALLLSAFGATRKADDELNMGGRIVENLLGSVSICAQAAMDTHKEIFGK